MGAPVIPLRYAQAAYGVLTDLTMQPTPTHLSPTRLIDSDHSAVQAFARAKGQGSTDRERAVALYYAVRDEFRYDPYRIDLSTEGMRASHVLEIGVGWCVPKAALLAAAARALGIPARVGYADVRNHLSTERLRQTLKTALFVWHGYTLLWIEGRWVKSTPAFNVQLCTRFGLLPLEWDGMEDSLYHPFDQAGNRHMEYVHERGGFDDMPLANIVADFALTYPSWQREPTPLSQADFLADVDREVG